MVKAIKKNPGGIDMGELKVIGVKSSLLDGDIVEDDLKLTWRKDNAEEVALAEQAFKEYISKGWIAIGEGSGKKSQVFTFDPSFDKIVLAPFLMGG